MTNKLDYSKTINEQRDTFSIYENNYKGYQLTIQKQNLEIERLSIELEREQYKVKEYGSRMLKAIEYIHNNYPVCAGKELLSILQGEDKE